MTFLPLLGLSAAALGLVQLGAQAVTVQILKAMLAVPLAVTLLLAIALVSRWHKDTNQ